MNAGPTPAAKPRQYSLAYLTANSLAPAQALQLAGDLGYQFVGLRLLPNSPGAPQQFLIAQPQAIRETKAVQRDTGVRIFDLEIIRIDDRFNLAAYLPLFEIAAELGAKALLVAGDDTNPSRLAQRFAELCDATAPYGLTANLEFMPWTAVKDAKAAMQTVTAAGRPQNAGILIDALHFGRSGTSLADIRALPREMLHYAQICDAESGTHFTTEQMIHTARSDRMLPGEGSIDLRGLFQELSAQLVVSVEIVNDVRMKAVGQTEWARQCLRASRGLLETAPV